MRRTWIALSVLALVTGGIVAGRATAGDEPKDGGGMPQEACIDGNALVKALTANAWTTKASGMWESEGKVSFRLGAGKTLVVEDYDSKGAMGDFHGLGVFKFAADGKTATVWWFDSMMPADIEFKGPVSDTGYELTGDMPGMDGKPGKGTIKLVKKGEGYEFTMSSNGQVMMTDVYTKAK